jgi:hypothetical protein
VDVLLWCKGAQVAVPAWLFMVPLIIQFAGCLVLWVILFLRYFKPSVFGYDLRWRVCVGVPVCGTDVRV